MGIFTLSLLLTLNSAFGFGTAKQDNKDYASLNPVHINAVEIKSAKPNAKNIEPGDTIEVRIKLNIDIGFHAYLDQYKLELADPSGYDLSEIQVSPVVKFKDPITKKEKTGTENYAEVVALLYLPQNLSTGAHKVPLLLTYQACGADFCLFPKKIPAQVKFEISSQATDMLARAMARGWLNTLFFVFLAGILTSLTPCIFPMIPITLAVLGTKEAGRSRAHGFLLSITYVLGIALTYSVLGIVAAKTGALFGSLLGHPVVVGVIAGLFVLMGLSMYGLFEVKLPDFITNKLAHRRSQKGFIGAFGSALIAGVVASPCVGPVLISILAYVAQAQNTMVGFVLLFTFALGLGQLFILLGTFHGLIARLPKSGPWLEQIKFIFGTMMIAMALYYVYPVAHSALFDGLIATALILIAVIFGVFKKDPHLKFGTRRTQKALLYSILIAGFVFATKSLVPEHMRSQFLFGLSSAKETKSYAKPEWFTYSDELLAKAKAEGRPVIIDFNAEWCLACKELEVYTFSDPRVLEAGKVFLWLSFDATSPSDDLNRLQKQYSIGGLPFIAFYDKKGVWRKDITLTGFENADEFLKRLKLAE